MSIIYITDKGETFASRIDTDKTNEWVRANFEASSVESEPAYLTSGNWGQNYIDSGHWRVVSSEWAFEKFPLLRPAVEKYLGVLFAAPKAAAAPALTYGDHW